jgi:hypothetical protein
MSYRQNLVQTFTLNYLSCFPPSFPLRYHQSTSTLFLYLTRLYFLYCYFFFTTFYDHDYFYWNSTLFASSKLNIFVEIAFILPQNLNFLFFLQIFLCNNFKSILCLKISNSQLFSFSILMLISFTILIDSLLYYLLILILEDHFEECRL